MISVEKIGESHDVFMNKKYDMFLTEFEKYIDEKLIENNGRYCFTKWDYIRIQENTLVRIKCEDIEKYKSVFIFTLANIGLAEYKSMSYTTTIQNLTDYFNNPLKRADGKGDNNMKTKEKTELFIVLNFAIKKYFVNGYYIKPNIDNKTIRISIDKNIRLREC